jgi:hypothetical protein
MDIYDNRQYPFLELVFRADGKFPFLLEACFHKSKGRDAVTELFDDPPGKKLLSAVCILIALAKYKGVHPDKPDEGIRFREVSKRFSWLNSLGIDKKQLETFFDDYFDGVNFFFASRGTEQTQTMKEAGGGTAGSVEFNPIKLRLENITLFKNDRSTKYKPAELPGLAVSLEKNGFGKHQPWEPTVQEHVARIAHAKPSQPVGNGRTVSSSRDEGSPHCVLTPKWLDLFQEKLTDIEGREIGGNWYVICGTPLWMLQWRRLFCNAVIHQGAKFKFAHHAPTSPDSCLSVTAQWKMNIEHLQDPDPIGLLKQRMRDGIAELSVWAANAKKQDAKGTFEFFESYITHPYVAVLIVPESSRKDIKRKGGAPSGTICLLSFYTFYSGSLEDRLGICFDRPSPALDIYYNSITSFFEKGPKDGYLKPVDHLARRTQRGEGNRKKP